MIKFIATLLSLLFSFLAVAQSSLDFSLNKHFHSVQSYSYTTFNNNFDTENASLYVLLKNPAFTHWYSNSKLKNNPGYSSYGSIMSSLNHNKNKYNYHPFQGSSAVEGAILAGGEKSIQGIGTLQGAAFYSREQKKDVSLNYTVNPQDYYPYLISDTLGAGKMEYEQYAINGNFGFSHKNKYYGISALYHGTAVSKLTDPRLAIYNSWFRLNLGILLRTKKKLYGINIYPEINRQNISANTFLQRTAKYLQFYGLGAWNKKESKAGYSHESLYTIKGIGTDIIIKKLNNTISDLAYTVSLGYNYRKMQTETVDAERNTYTNLYSSTTHHFKPEFTVSLTRSKLSYHLQLANDFNFRAGTEHIYESRKNSGDIYSYEKVSSKKMYHSYTFSNKLRAKSIYTLSTKRHLHALLGLSHSYYKEQYEFPIKEIKQQSLTPFIGIGYSSSFDKGKLEANIQISSQRALKNSFNVPLNEQNIVKEQVYIPYLIRGENNKSILSSITYTHKIYQQQSLGIQLLLNYLKSTKLPIINAYASKRPFQEKREVLSFSLNLFYSF